MTDLVSEELVTPKVNGQKLLSVANDLFSSSTSFIGELLQNSRRAGAGHIQLFIEQEPGKEDSSLLRIVDDGVGIADFSALTTLCESDWSEQTMLTDNPFGMGFFSVLYAGETTTVISRGKELQASRAALKSGHPFKLISRPDNPEAGTQIIITGIKKPAAHLHDAIKRAAKGFRVRISINAEPAEQDHAHLPYKETALGRLSIRGVHFDLDRLPRESYYYVPSLYLQGLPILVNDCRADPNFVFHLDTQQFRPVMPDRSRLIDAEEAEKKIQECVFSVMQEFLTEQKSKLPPEEFAQRYFDSCHGWKCLHLLNDIPFLPRSWAKYVYEVTADSDSLYEIAEDAPGKLVSRSELLKDGAILCPWGDMEDDPRAPSFFCFAQKANQKIVYPRVALDPGHWIFKDFVGAEDLNFQTQVDRGNFLDQSGIFLDADNPCCSVRAIPARSCTVQVSACGPIKFEREIVFEHDFFVELEEEDNPNPNYAVYVFRNRPTFSSPVLVFRDFYNRDSDEIDEAEKEESLEWYSTQHAVMFGATMAQVMKNRIGTYSIGNSQSYNGQMVAVYQENIHHLEVVDLDLPFWSAVAEKLAVSGISAPMLQEALRHVIASKKRKLTAPHA